MEDNTTKVMHVKNYEEPLMEYGAYRLHKYLMVYAPPILLIIGTVGNVLSVVILCRRAMRKMSTYFYLAILSLADTVVLYVGLLRLWLGEIMGRDIRDLNDWSCKIITFLGYIASDFSGWLIIAVTFERFVAVCYPFRASVICKREKAITIAVSLFVILGLVNCHFFWTVRVVYFQHGGEYIPQCHSPEPYIQLIDFIWPWVDACIYSFLPFVIILILNAFIIRQIVRARHARKLMMSSANRNSYGRRTFVHVAPSSASSDRDGKVTIMLIVISFTFLLTTLPMNVSLIVTKFIIKQPRNVEMLINLRLMMTVTEMLMYVNHSINFVLYCATGQKFRAELICLFVRKKKPTITKPPTPHSAYSAQGSRAMHIQLANQNDAIHIPERLPLRPGLAVSL